MSRERETVYVNQSGVPIKSQAEIDLENARLRAVETADATDNKWKDVVMSDEEKLGRQKIAEFFALPEKERKARHSAILDRGVMFDRLSVDLPADLHGEWIRNESMAIDHMRGLGFWVDETYATRRALNSDGTKANIVGDVIFMVTMKENKRLIDRVHQERVIREQRNPKQQREETEGREKVPVEIPVFSESNSRPMTAADIKTALDREAAQTSVQR
jgi:hypothetical protein